MLIFNFFYTTSCKSTIYLLNVYNIGMELGTILKKWRESYGISKAQLAKATQISNQNISRWENNLVAPTVEFCIILARYYGITLEELLDIDLP